MKKLGRRDWENPKRESTVESHPSKGAKGEAPGVESSLNLRMRYRKNFMQKFCKVAKFTLLILRGRGGAILGII